jgi:hypothetical protein
LNFNEKIKVNLNKTNPLSLLKMVYENKMDDENSDFDFYIEFNYQYFDDEIPMYITIEGNNKFPEDTSITFFGVEGKKINFMWIEKNEGLKKKFVDCLVGEYKNK